MSTLVKETVLNMYDTVFPEMKHCMDKWIDYQAALASGMAGTDLDKMGLTQQEVGHISNLLPMLLDMHRQKLRDDGEVDQMIGWLHRDKMCLVPVTVPYEKYRFFRGVSEVARRIDAEAVVLITDGYVLENGSRTGTEVLSAMYINPDATCSMASAHYTRRRHPQVTQDIIDFLPEYPGDKEANEKRGHNQHLVPAWGRLVTD